MLFMKNDEFLLLMVHCEGRVPAYDNQKILSVEERSKLRAVGIQTAHEQPAWALIEPAQGQYNWDYLDNIVNRNRQSGLKTLIQVTGWRLPSWIPSEWKAKRNNGIFEDEQLSLWNEEAQIYSDHYCQVLLDRYTDPDVAFFIGEFQGGEGVYPPTECFFDTASLTEYKSKFGNDAEPSMSDPQTVLWFGDKAIQHYLRRSKILYPKYKEVWDCKQKLMDRWSTAYGNYTQPELLETYRKEFPDGNIVLLQYTYFDASHGQIEHDWVDELVRISNCEVIVEAMFCAGLPTTTPRAIAKGFRGQIVHPANDINGEPFEQWMIDNIKNSHNEWMRSRGL